MCLLLVFPPASSFRAMYYIGVYFETQYTERHRAYHREGVFQEMFQIWGRCSRIRKDRVTIRDGIHGNLGGKFCFISDLKRRIIKQVFYNSRMQHFPCTFGAM